jgi:single-strand DNA-binding protein
MLNRCEFIGNAGADPDIKTTNSGNKVANISLAVTDKWKNKQTGAREERTEWIRLNCFQEGLIGVIENYVKKGSKIFVAGKMQTRKYQTQDGQDRYSTEINVREIELLDGKDNRDNSGGNYGAAQQGQAGNFDQDDIPFAPEWR